MSSRINDADVIIVGAGIAGLGLACALSCNDIKILVLEKRRQSATIHRGSGLPPKASALLKRWGVYKAFINAGAQNIAHMDVFHPSMGHMGRVPLTPPNTPDPYLVLPHSQIEATLRERALALGKTNLVRPGRVTELIRDGVTQRVLGVRFKGENGQREARARLVVGTDGHRSLVRNQLGIKLDTYAYKHAFLTLEATHPPGYNGVLNVHLHPEGGILLMPRLESVGLGVTVPSGNPGYWRRLPDKDLLAILASRVPVLKHVRLLRHGENVYTLSRAHARRYLVHGAVIIGDAAHRTNPTAGQGMAMALTDAGALADAVGPLLLGDRNVLDRALASFESSQRALNKKLVFRSHLLAMVYGLHGPRWDWTKAMGIRFLCWPPTSRLVRPLVGAFLNQKKATATGPA